MCQSSEKVVPEWDTDLNLRLKQLDNVLATAKTTSLTSDEEVDLQERKRYGCSLCPAKFNSNAARNSHKRRIHERLHLCHDCDMAFASAQKLERHMKTHSGIKEFKCDTCGKEFMIERNLVSFQKQTNKQTKMLKLIHSRFCITNCIWDKKILFVLCVIEPILLNPDCKRI